MSHHSEHRDRGGNDFDMGKLLRAQMMMNLASRGLDNGSIKGLLAMQAIEVAANKFPSLVKWVFHYWNRQPVVHRLMSATGQTVTEERVEKASILIEKYFQIVKGGGTPAPVYSGAGSQQRPAEHNTPTAEHLRRGSGRVVDSIVHLVASLDYVKSLVYNNDVLLPNFQEAVPLDKGEDIWFSLNIIRKDGEGQLEFISFRVFSYTRDIIYLKNFLHTREKEYSVSISNKLGESLYFFDHNIIKLSVQGGRGRGARMDPRSMMGNVPQLPFLTYNKHVFHTNRTFDNIFFEEKDLVKSRLDFFINNREWYDAKGIPYTLGFLFYGVPGCGKTSTIKAIANITKRHIINVNLAEIKTKKQLKSLFFTEDIVTMRSAGVEVRADNTDVFQIPIKQRLYVIEDIDASASVASRFHRSKSSSPEIVEDPFGSSPAAANESFPAHQHMEIHQIDGGEEEIDLQTLLNVLDGTLENPERMMIVTTNRPEKLDPALIRPGRIDMFVQFKKANASITAQMYESFYSKVLPLDVHFPEYKWTPAEINQLLFRCFHSPAEFVHIICDEDPTTVFKHSYLDESNF